MDAAAAREILTTDGRECTQMEVGIEDENLELDGGLDQAGDGAEGEVL